MKKGEKEFFIIDSQALPTIYAKVMEVKKLLAVGTCETILEAVNRVGISRSAYYKYKDSVHPFFEKTKDRVVTLTAMLNNVPGVLSNMLACFAEHDSNILTINQNIPSNGVALVSISFETGHMTCSVDTLMMYLRSLHGVATVSVVGSELLNKEK